MSQPQFTKAGHVLEQAHAGGALAFLVRGQTAYAPIPGGPPAGTVFLLSQLAVVTPCTRSEVAAHLRAWLSVYGDNELLNQIDPAVEQAFAMLPEAPPVAPSTPAPPPAAAPPTIN